MLNSKIISHKTFKDIRGSLGVLEHNLFDIKWDRTITSYNKKKHTFRGMHYQTPSYQTKYIKVVKGKIIDFLYNLDTNQVEMYNLNSGNGLLVPPNYAHGYLTLKKDTIVSYLISGDYLPKDEKIISYKDIEVISNILSRYNDIVVSDKDLLINS